MDDLRKVLSRNSKPIIVLKGGKTKTGSVAAKSHTASISGNNKLWNAFFKQYNMVEVNSLEHLLNAARMIQCYGICDLENIAVFSISGGYGVVMVDLIENSGLKVPQFTSETQEKLREKFYALGTSSLNPLDVAAQFFNTKWTKEIMEIAISDKNIDALIMDIPSWYFNIEYFFTPDPDFEKNIYAAFELGHKYKKPLILIIQRAHCPESHTEVSRRLIEKKVPVYGDPQEIIPLLNKISRLNNSKI